jgi:hypothetical protein
VVAASPGLGVIFFPEDFDPDLVHQFGSFELAA